MPVLSNHCDPDQMVLLVENRLGSDEIARIEQHLDQCPACRENFDRLVSDDHWLGAVRRHLGAEPVDQAEPALRAHETLEFLTPSDWPDSLGRLGAYEIKGMLGRGGMGVVLKAFDPVLRRNVAVKVLSAALASSGAARQRFLREARAAAAVVHPHVVAVYAVVESAGLPFLVMEYVPGRSLQERLDKLGPLSLAEVLRIGMQTAAGLASAHVQGLVHRDVKPANILLEDGVERVRLTDFGLARAAVEASLTRSGVVAGTPHYMAPEQARGEVVDQRADLFSLGSTMYAMCAGHPPFRADSALAVLKRVCDNEPRALLEVNPEMPAWLQAILCRLMAKDPANRFQTAGEVHDLLERCLAHVQQPLAVPLPDDPILRPQQSAPNRSGRRRAALVVLFLLMAGVASTVWWNPAKTHDAGQNHEQSAPDQAATMPAFDWPGAAGDELGSQIMAAQGKADAIEASLHHGQSSDQDQIAGLLRELTAQAKALEKEIASGQSRSSTNPYYPLPSNSNDRR